MEPYVFIVKNTYQDSIKVMQFQSILSETIPGIISCGVAMGTPGNKSFFREAGLFAEQLQQAGPNDLCIVVKVASRDALALARAEIEKHFSSDKASEGYSDHVEILPTSISSALKRFPNANLSCISVPGRYAALEAYKALSSGLHVFLFSDNVSLEDELDLKSFAERKGLLMMGPDCGTAVISGIPLGFSNALRRGKIGIIGASGTGMQEISCLIHGAGEGISHAVGTGGRDLSAEVGGKTFMTALKALLYDENTKVIVLMSKHCDEKVAKRMVDKVRESKKPVVVYFPGFDSFIENNMEHIYKAKNIEHAAAGSVALLRAENFPESIAAAYISKEYSDVIKFESRKFSSEQKYVRSLLTGGSFADQANMIFTDFFETVYAYPSFGKTSSPDSPLQSTGHCIVDLGDDYFTRGRLHPMIDPALRIERIAEEIKDKQLKVLLLDVVLGYGAHPDPAGALTGIIIDAKRTFRDRDGYLSVVVSLCGTENDFQDFNAQRKMLEATGAIVVGSSTRAALLAALIGSQQKNEVVNN